MRGCSEWYVGYGLYGRLPEATGATGCNGSSYWYPSIVTRAHTFISSTGSNSIKSSTF